MDPDQTRHRRVLHFSSTAANVHSDEKGWFSSFTGTFKNPNNLDKCVHVTPCYASVPNLIDNITTENGLLAMTINGKQRLVRLPASRYSHTEIANLIQAAVNTQINAEQTLLGTTVQNTFTLTQNAAGYITVVNTDDATIKLVLVNEISTPVNGMIGVISGTGFVVTSTVTELPMLPNFIDAGRILIHLDEHAGDHAYSPGQHRHSVAAVVNMSYTPFGSTAVWEPSAAEQWRIVFNHPRDVHSWTFRFTNAKLEPVRFPSNCEITIVFSAEFVT